MAQHVTIKHARVGSGAVRTRGWADWSDRHFKWLLVAPALVLILALTVYPLAYSVWVAFVNFDFQIPGHAFVGLQNFEHVIEDPVARWSLLTTAILSVSSVVLEFLLGLGLAMAMTKTFAGRGVIMLILIVPLFVSPVVVGQIWSLILQKPYGPFDYLVSQLFGPTEVS
jgi:multiple sugar transport system permease protein